MTDSSETARDIFVVADAWVILKQLCVPICEAYSFVSLHGKALRLPQNNLVVAPSHVVTAGSWAIHLRYFPETFFRFRRRYFRVDYSG